MVDAIGFVAIQNTNFENDWKFGSLQGIRAVIARAKYGKCTSQDLRREVSFPF